MFHFVRVEDDGRRWSDAPHWDAWRRRLEQALARGADLFTDQVALNTAVYLDGLVEQAPIRESVCASLRAAGVLGSVNLVAGASPTEVEQLASRAGRK